MTTFGTNLVLLMLALTLAATVALVKNFPAAKIIRPQIVSPVEVYKFNHQDPSPAPSKPSGPAPDSSSDFQYPGSRMVEKSAGSTSYESPDDPQTITNWYRRKIESLGMPATSFIQTNTNGNILNKLIGAKGSSQWSVEITKTSGDPVARIRVVSS